jgi:hypothetical protein
MGFGQAETLKVAGQLAANYLLGTVELAVKKSSCRPTGRQLPSLAVNPFDGEQNSPLWRRTLWIARW